jgi:signal transduction histidine kinase
MAFAGFDRVEWALRERVKELTCLYGIARVAQRRELTLKEALTAIVALLPPAWQFSDIATARIVLDGQVHSTHAEIEEAHRQWAELVVGGVSRGIVEVVYPKAALSSPENPFLAEEQSLIEMVAREISLLVEHHEAEAQRAKLQDQLRHADRLATIGQLAAGVAHEINEPLANVLGFAQLAKKTPHIPKQAAEDMDKIVRNCLHAREVIQKLLTFARQMPPEKSRIDLNQVVADALALLESRCASAGIEVVSELAPELPTISADASQLRQVLVNLLVNAVQAMPEGGTVTIRTHAAQEAVVLTVTDTGEGMTEEVKGNIFNPFFTTKDVDQGTGLGLAVVHGIVAGHGGAINVESSPGQGAKFEISLPIERQ